MKKELRVTTTATVTLTVKELTALIATHVLEKAPAGEAEVGSSVSDVFLHHADTLTFTWTERRDE